MFNYLIKNISEISENEYRETFDMMTPARQAKVKRLRSEASKKCTLAGEMLARRLLSEATAKPLDFFNISANENGKPELENIRDIFFNISHSEGTVVAAISDREIGVDIEVIRPVSLSLAKKLCLDDELSYIFGKTPSPEDFDNIPSADCLRRFFEIWTIKEAYLKCLGIGISGFKTINALTGNFKKHKIENNNHIIHFVTVKD